MKVGSVVYCTDQGLGLLARDFYENDIVTDVVIVQHKSRVNNYGWYPQHTPILTQPCHFDNWLRTVQALIDRVDAMLFFETPFVWEAIAYCKRQGKKSFLMTMYECTPKEIPVEPDVYLCPSDLDYNYFSNKPNCVRINVPVRVNWKKRTTAEVFVHNAGHGGLKGRNGTIDVVAAMHLTKSPARMIIRCQDPTTLLHPSEPIHLQNRYYPPNTEVRIGTFDRDTLYDEGDVFVFPERFNGLSLPIQEAYAAGMLIMATDRYPNNTYLPSPPLLPIYYTSLNQSVSSRFLTFTESFVDPKAIAQKIDEWYGKDIQQYSLEGADWATSNSWKILGTRYKEILSK